MDEEYIEIDNDSLCRFCYAEFLDSEDLKLHIVQYHLNEKNTRRFCKFCSIIFTDLDAFVLHICNYHLPTICTCNYCLRVFNDVESLSTHEKKHKNLKHYPKISCSQCTKLFDDKNDLENHEFEEHGDSEDGMMLQYCFPELSSVIRMNIRTFFVCIHSHNYKCICNFTTTDVAEYFDHLKISKCKLFVCEICSNVFRRKIAIENHMRTHFKFEKPDSMHNRCPKCDQSFSQRNINSHIKKCRSMKCVPCGILFDSIDKYTIHMTTHPQRNQVKFLVCRYCHRSLVGETALQKHIDKTHKPFLHLYKYYCLTCDKVFKHPKLLFGHYFSSHKDIEPFTCKICDKKFRIRKNFTLHIKIDHKSVGFVEFDSNYHVFFTDKKSENPFEPRNLSIDDSFDEEPKKSRTKNEETSILKKDNKESSKERMDISATLVDNSEDSNRNNTDLEESVENDDKSENIETNDDQTVKKDLHNASNNSFKLNTESEKEADNENNLKSKIASRKRKFQSMKKPIKIIDLASSDSDSDAPLSRLNKRKKIKSKKRGKYNKVKGPKKFICKTCDRNCYTYQNYHRHMSLHAKNQKKVCLKCGARFKTKEALNRHIQKHHSHSQLTETLKKLLDKRKNTIDMTQTKDTSTNMFMKTLHKVPREKNNSHATIIVVENDQSPVKKFLESFKPENSENTNNSIVNIKKVIAGKREPLIKMKKFEPETISLEPLQLRMPVKFVEENHENHRVSIKLVRCEYVTSSINFEPEHKVLDSELQAEYLEETNEDSHDDSYDYNSEIRTESIPEVGQEIQLEGCEDNRPKVLKKSIVLDDLLTPNNIRIGHLAPQAPYYKIVKVSDVLTETQRQQKNVNKITLPNGTKLVSVNPLAHLLGNTNIESIKKPNPKYKPKVQNISEALMKAMNTLTVPVKKSGKCASRKNNSAKT